MVRWLVESETVYREDKELYEYAVYSLFLTVTPIVLILIIGSLLGKTIQGTSQEQYGLNGAVVRLCKQNSHSLKREPAP